MTAYDMRISDWSSDVCSSDENNEATAHELEKMGATAIPLHVDLGDVDQIRAAFKHVADEFGRLDASAHIGGYSWRGETLDVTEDLWTRVMNVNIRGTFFCLTGRAHV